MSGDAGSSICSNSTRSSRTPGSSRCSASPGALWILHVALILMAIWLSSSFRPAVAIRMLPAGSSHGFDNKYETTTTYVGRRPLPSGNASPAPPDASDFDDSKRRVPSCPDPLHNR